MPSTIPYDPSLVLGNIVTQEKLDIVTKISSLQAPADAAEDTLNSFISLKRSVDMTIQELIEMNIDATDLITESQDIGTKITAAAKDYGKAKIASELAIQPLKAKIRTVNDSIESPVDFNKTQIKTLPLSADSIKMNVQYFAFDSNQQSSGSHASTVASFVSDTVGIDFGSDSGSIAKQSSRSVQTQVSSQLQNHDIAGTLVIAITCTHKDAAILAPFILDCDKAVHIWNDIYPDDKIKTTDPMSIMQAVMQQGTKDEKSISILSGQTCGSSFVGMVHVLNTTQTTSSEQLYSVATSLQAQMDVSCWFAKVNGGYGSTNSFTNDAKNLLSVQNVTSHCTLTVMGSIPSIKAGSVKMGVKQFTVDEDPMKAVVAVQNATASEMDTIDSSATAARTGAQMQSMQASKVKSALSALGDLDSAENKIIDTNTMMTAMEDYINKCLSGNIGVPINYYVKPITKSEIAMMWLQKYYPSKLTARLGGGDDSKPDASQGGQQQ